MLQQWFEPAGLKRYRQYRAAQVALNNKLSEQALAGSAFEEAVRSLGVGASGRQLVLENDDEIGVILDYALHEAARPGARVVDLYRQQPGGADPVERELLDAAAASQVGLFRVAAIDKHAQQLTLKQLAPVERDVLLTDVGFSQTSAPGMVFFSRLLELADFTMTGGAALAFGPEREAEVLAVWKQTNPLSRYRKFFKLHRRIGIVMIYRDAGPAENANEA